MTNPITQSELDRLVAERFSWTARFASAMSHDLGNILLFSSSPSQNEVDASDELCTCRQRQAALMSHVRKILTAMDLWRRVDASEPQPFSVKSWWAVHGSMLRQFVSPRARVVLVNFNDELIVDGMQLSRVVAAMLVGLDAQVDSLARIALGVSGEPDGNRVWVTFAVSPGIGTPVFVIPSVTMDHIGAEDGIQRGIQDGVEQIVLNLTNAFSRQ